jgi:hypothetical protein
MENLPNKSKLPPPLEVKSSISLNNGHSTASESQEESKYKQDEGSVATEGEKKSSGCKKFEVVFSDEFLFEALLEFLTFEETIRLI